MATNEPPPPPTPSDVLHTLRQAASQLQSWMAYLESFDTDNSQLGPVVNAKRIGRIARETVNDAFCATREIEHHAVDQAEINVA